jgi:hypothetical protein
MDVKLDNNCVLEAQILGVSLRGIDECNGTAGIFRTTRMMYRRFVTIWLAIK